MIPQPPSPGEDGFSILEMIVAMTILALVLGIASRSIAVAKAQIEDARTVRAMLAAYQANTGLPAADPDSPARPGWTLSARKIEVSKAKMIAIIIAKTGASGAGRGAPFLTFVPTQDAGSQ